MKWPTDKQSSDMQARMVEQHRQMCKDPVWRGLGNEHRELREQLADVAFGYACFLAEGSAAAAVEAEKCREGIIIITDKIHDVSRRMSERVARMFPEPS